MAIANRSINVEKCQLISLTLATSICPMKCANLANLFYQNLSVLNYGVDDSNILLCNLTKKHPSISTSAILFLLNVFDCCNCK